jgi:SAM-dependent methyltransferase
MLRHGLEAHRALVLGDGDGRFTAELARTNPHVQIDYVDLSSRMGQLTQARVNASDVSNPGRVVIRQGDAREMPWEAHYQLVATHFFFDVFEADDLRRLIARVAAGTDNSAIWMVSEFDLPSGGWVRVGSAILIRTMYLFFRIAAGLRTRRIADWRQSLRLAGFERQEQAFFWRGLIVSELWRKRQLSRESA